MVVDIDEECVVQALKARSLNAVALQKNHSIRLKTIRRAGSLANLLRAGQRSVDDRDGIVELHFRLLAHRVQHHPKRQQGANGVAVRACMRCQQKAVPLQDRIQYGVDWLARRFCRLRVDAPTVFNGIFCRSAFGHGAFCHSYSCSLDAGFRVPAFCALSCCNFSFCRLRRSTRPSNSSILARTGSE